MIGDAASAPAFCVLGSGSSGNCTVVEIAPRLREDGGESRRAMLIDLGLSPRCTRQRLRSAGLCWGSVTDILLTHLDRDHLCPGWLRPLHGAAIRVHASPEHCLRLREAGVPPDRLEPVDAGHLLRLGDETTARSILLPHDEGWSLGWLIEDRGLRIGYATDLGRAPPTLLEFFDSLDAVLLESNYDPPMQLASRRPEFLKSRIMGGRGHLSNEEALDVILELDRRGRLQRIMLLHLSRQCNDPQVIRSLWSARAPHLAGRLHLSSQHVASPLLTLSPRSCPSSAGGQSLWE